MGCNDRANAAHRQKNCRPEGFRANSRKLDFVAPRSKTHEEVFSLVASR